MRDEIRWWLVPVTFAFLWASVVGPPFALLPLLVAYWERHEYPTLGRSHRGDVRTGQEPTPSADRGPSRPGASARSMRCKSREEIENFAYGSFCSPQPQMKR